MHKILANTVFLGKEIIYMTECHSTNDLAAQKFKDGTIREGSIIITDKQTKGRGQRGNRWFSEPDQNLTFSLVLTPSFMDPSEQFDLSRAIALAVRDAVSDYVTGIKVKWPNDIVHENRGKLGGILIENTVSQKGIDLSVVGIGLNINQEEFPFPGPVSMANLAGAALDREEIFKHLIAHIEKRYVLLKKGGAILLRRQYHDRLHKMSEWGEYEDEKSGVFKGMIQGVTPEGKLMIQKQDDTVNHYGFKEVKML